MRIDQNVSFVNNHTKNKVENNLESNSLTRLTVGLKSPKSNMSQNEKMRSQIDELKDSVKALQDNISSSQSLESRLKDTHLLLNRMKNLAGESVKYSKTSKEQRELKKMMNELHEKIAKLEKEDREAKKLQRESLDGDLQELIELKVANKTKKALDTMWPRGFKKANIELEGRVWRMETSSKDINKVTMTTAKKVLPPEMEEYGHVRITLVNGATAKEIIESLGSMGIDISLEEETKLALPENVDLTSEEFKFVAEDSLDFFALENSQLAREIIDEAIDSVVEEKEQASIFKEELKKRLDQEISRREKLKEYTELRKETVEENLETNKKWILEETARAMLSQANQKPELVYSLLNK